MGRMLEGTTLGTLVELMVEAEVLAGSGGRLISSRMEPDVDHRDIVVAEVGGFGALWLQVKGTTPSRRGGADRRLRQLSARRHPRECWPSLSRLPSRCHAASAGEDMARPLRGLQPAGLPRTLEASRPGHPPVAERLARPAIWLIRLNFLGSWQ